MRELFDDYRAFRNAGPPYPAFRLLSELFVSASNPPDKEFLSYIDAEAFNQEELLEIHAAVERDILEIRRLLTIFDIWIFEELVFVLTLRIQVDLVRALLVHKGHRDSESADLTKIDKKLGTLLRDARNAKAYAEAVRAIRRNWKIPLSGAFLGASTSVN